MISVNIHNTVVFDRRSRTVSITDPAGQPVQPLLPGLPGRGVNPQPRPGDRPVQPGEVVGGPTQVAPAPLTVALPVALPGAVRGGPRGSGVAIPASPAPAPGQKQPDIANKGGAQPPTVTGGPAPLPLPVGVPPAQAGLQGR